MIVNPVFLAIFSRMQYISAKGKRVWHQQNILRFDFLLLPGKDLLYLLPNHGTIF
jgi:hypothetical protein